MTQAHRITVRRGKDRRAFVLTQGPVPEKGDICTIRNEDWEVAEVRRTTVLIDQPIMRSRQEFPARHKEQL